MPHGEIQRDLPAEAVAIEEDRLRAGGGEGPDFEEIGNEQGIIADIAAAPLGTAMAAEVPGQDAETGGIEALDDMAVAAQVLPHAMRDEDAAPSGPVGGVRRANEEPCAIADGVHPVAG